MKKEYSFSKAMPVLFGFFIVGFVDLVGIANSYVKKDFELSDTLANLLPMMVFLWFAVFAIPASLLMNSLGRKNPVMGVFSDCIGQVGGILILLGSMIYLFFSAFSVQKDSVSRSYDLKLP